MDQMASIQLHNSSNNSISPPTLHRDTDIVIVRIGEMPRVGDIWILKCVRSLNDFTHFFIPIIENLFQAGDKILRTKIIEVMHYRFFMKATIWIKTKEGSDGQ